MATSLANIHPDIIQTHILPLLDGRSLSSIAAASSHLRSLTSDHNLWSNISRCTWPSITHPRIHDIISTFPGGHRSFFNDSFPSLVSQVNHLSNSLISSPSLPSELISAVDIRYEADIIYSTVMFTEFTHQFLTSELLFKLNEDGINKISRPIHLEDGDMATLSNLKESLTLNWILIDPSIKRACNLSSIKAVKVKKDWVSNETFVKYVTFLSGCGPNEMVQCRILVVLGRVGNGGEGLYVKDVMMRLIDLDYGCLYGTEFLTISRRAILEENNVTRKVVDDDDVRRKSQREFKEMRIRWRELIRQEELKRATKVRRQNIGIFVSCCFSLYVLRLMLQ